jgi:phosphoribosylglycinamide formyltransferase-1
MSAARRIQTDARPSHGSPGWRVGGEKSGKFFAYVSVRHHGEDAVALLVKTSGADEMAALIEADPDIYYRPAYYGASGWIAIRLDRPGVDWDHIRGWLEKSWRAVAPKRLTKMMDVADHF